MKSTDLNISKPNLENTSHADIGSNKTTRNVTDTRPSPTKFNKCNIIITSSIFSFLMIIAFKYYYSFLIVDERYFKTVFYGWRTLYGDKNMFNTTWKYVNPNKYDRDDATDVYTKLVKMAQDDQLLFTGHVEHYPRGQNGYYTHSHCKFNRKFLKYRKVFCDAFDKPLTEEQLSGKEQVGDKDMKYWKGGKKVDVAEIYQNAPKMIKNVMVLLTVFLNNLYSGHYNKSGLVGKECPDMIAKDLQKIATAAELDLSTEYIKNIPINFGKAKADVFELFGYSRIFYLFYFHTLNAKIDVFNGLKEALEDATDNDKDKIAAKIAEIEKSKASRMKTVSTSLVEIFSNIYKYDFGTPDAKNGYFTNFMSFIFGNKQAKFVSQEKNIKILLDELNDIVEPEKVSKT